MPSGPEAHPGDKDEPLIEVAAGVVFRHDQILITQRPFGVHLGGLWEFPGGKKESFESYPTCLQRELREELGIEVEVLELIDSVTHRYPEKTVHLKFFRCHWIRNEPQALGCAHCRWVKLADLHKYDFPPADAPLLRKLGARYTGP